MLGVEPGPLQPTDSLLIPFLQEADAKEAERLLAELLTQHAAPVIKKVIVANIGNRIERGGNLPWPDDSDEIEDLMSEVNLKVLDRLRYLKLDSSRKPIGSFQGYVATTSYNMCHTYLRRKYPQRSRLKYKVRYILKHRQDFELWEDDQNQWICGYAEWQTQQRTPVKKGWINEIRNNPKAAESLYSTAPGELSDLVALIFDL